jgi:hypothetical protein
MPVLSLFFPMSRISHPSLCLLDTCPIPIHPYVSYISSFFMSPWCLSYPYPSLCLCILSFLMSPRSLSRPCPIRFFMSTCNQNLPLRVIIKGTYETNAVSDTLGTLEHNSVDLPDWLHVGVHMGRAEPGRRRVHRCRPQSPVTNRWHMGPTWMGRRWGALGCAGADHDAL